MTTPGLRDQLAATAASAAGPYGYTISLGGATALAVHRLTGPGLADALLLMLGAVAAFVVLEVVASRGGVSRPPPDRPPSILGNAHVPSAGAAICASWAVVRTVPAPFAWALTGFVTTAAYFLVTALQRIAVDAALVRVRRRRGPEWGP